jgi:hypothetical protein
MIISVCQIYIEPGVSFPFTHVFQAFVGSLLTTHTGPQEAFELKFGGGYDLIFNLSAKHSLRTPEIMGPTVFKRWKTVEYTIFLPGTQDGGHTREALRKALLELFSSISHVLQSLGMSCERISTQAESLADDILRDRTMANT